VLPAGPSTDPGNSDYENALEAQCLAAALALDAGDKGAAQAWLDSHDRWLEWSGAIYSRAEGQLLWARHYQQLGDLDEAQRRSEQALDSASDPRQPLALIAIHRFLGQLDTETQRFADAESHLQASLTLADACAVPFERALTVLALAELRMAQARIEEAGDLLAQVRAFCTPLQARPTLDRVEDLAAQLTQAAGSPPVSNGFPAGLTAREVEVLRLVAEGLTDAEVGERLYISPRTVGQHLRSVYNKLGVGSRTAAAIFAKEQGIA
jgi:ATP/maltotriose-dependent transcriptional regulator MalT